MDQANTTRLPTLTLSTWTADSRQVTRDWVRDQPEEVLLRLIREGSEEAMSVLFRRHASQVFSIGRRILRDPAEAEDLVQEVFVYVYRRAALYDSAKGSARSWLVQIAYTQALQRQRKLARHGLYDLPNWDKEKEVDASGNCPLYDQSGEGLFGRNSWRVMLESLSEDQRETLRLHFFEGYTFAEIAERIGQSHRNIRNHYYRGLEKLRKHLANAQLNVR
jgi:RNA polymerase sigma-70 factor (ECF subfamily)